MDTSVKDIVTKFKGRSYQALPSFHLSDNFKPILNANKELTNDLLLALGIETKSTGTNPLGGENFEYFFKGNQIKVIKDFHAVLVSNTLNSSSDNWSVKKFKIVHSGKITSQKVKKWLSSLQEGARLLSEKRESDSKEQKRIKVCDNFREDFIKEMKEFFPVGYSISPLKSDSYRISLRIMPLGYEKTEYSWNPEPNLDLVYNIESSVLGFKLSKYYKLNSQFSFNDLDKEYQFLKDVKSIMDAGKELGEILGIFKELTNKPENPS